MEIFEFEEKIMTEETLYEEEKNTDEVEYDENDDSLASQPYDLNNPMQMYMKEVCSRPLLSAEEEKALAILACNGDREARNKLCEHNLRLVVSIAKEYSNGNMMLLMDLTQEGNIGLLRAIDKFDVDKGWRLSTYATWWIKQAILRYIADHSSSIRLPAYIREQIYKMNKVEKALVQELGKEPTNNEIAERMGVPLSKVEELKLAALDPISLEIPVGENGDTTIGDFVEDKSSSQNDIENMLLKESVADMINMLSEKERKILILRYGLEDGRQRTLEEVGQVFGLTRERIRQIESKAFRKIRQAPKKKNAIHGFY